MTRQLKGIYLARLDVGAPYHLGVLNKINGQIKVLEQALGPVTSYFPRGLTIERNGDALTAFPNGPLANQRFHNYGFYNLLKKQSLKADYFYIRYQKSSFAFVSLLRQLRRDNPNATIILEIPTFPYELEVAGLRHTIKLQEDRLTRRALKKYVDYILTFSPYERIFDIPTIKTQNGIDVDAVTQITPPPLKSPLQLVGVANVNNWHGYDRVITGLQEYYGKRPERLADIDVEFNIVGDGAALPGLKALAAQSDRDDAVRFHGVLNGDALTDILSKSHIAVSSLGMHRTKSETTLLKSREYCARGIPFINAYNEVDIDKSFPYAFHIPQDDTPVDIVGLVDYYDALRQNGTSFSDEMRLLAEQKLSWASKLMPVITAILSSPERA